MQNFLKVFTQDELTYACKLYSELCLRFTDGPSLLDKYTIFELIECITLKNRIVDRMKHNYQTAKVEADKIAGSYLSVLQEADKEDHRLYKQYSDMITKKLEQIKSRLLDLLFKEELCGSK